MPEPMSNSSPFGVPLPSSTTMMNKTIRTYGKRSQRTVPVQKQPLPVRDARGLEDPFAELFSGAPQQQPPTQRQPPSETSLEGELDRVSRQWDAIRRKTADYSMDTFRIPVKLKATTTTSTSATTTSTSTTAPVKKPAKTQAGRRPAVKLVQFSSSSSSDGGDASETEDIESGTREAPRRPLVRMQAQQDLSAFAIAPPPASNVKRVSVPDLAPHQLLASSPDTSPVKQLLPGEKEASTQPLPQDTPWKATFNVPPMAASTPLAQHLSQLQLFPDQPPPLQPLHSLAPSTGPVTTVLETTFFWDDTTAADRPEDSTSDEDEKVLNDMEESIQEQQRARRSKLSTKKKDEVRGLLVPSETASPVRLPPMPTVPVSGNDVDIVETMQALSLLQSTSAIVSPNAALIQKYGEQVAGILTICRQTDPYPFEEFIKHCVHGRVTKLGEATFSEVYVGSIDRPFRLPAPYSADDRPVHERSRIRVAMKVLPFGTDPKVTVNEEPQTTPENLYQELFVTRALSRMQEKYQSNFVQAYGATVVQGTYANALLRSWDAYEQKSGSENLRPDYFREDQLYCVLMLEYGGMDLEHSILDNYDQAVSILAQVSYSLAEAEAQLQFEHRDLHWGNILVQPTSVAEIHYPCYHYGQARLSAVPTHGIRCCIIDYTFSRLSMGAEQGGETFFRSYDDDAYFEGEGDYQFEIYRKMRDHVASVVGTDVKAGGNHRVATRRGGNVAAANGGGALLDWSCFVPQTNIYWLHYLVDKLLHGDVEYAANRTTQTKKTSKRSAAQNASEKEGKNGEDASKALLQAVLGRLLTYKDAREFVAKDSFFLEL